MLAPVLVFMRLKACGPDVSGAGCLLGPQYIMSQEPFANQQSTQQRGIACQIDYAKHIERIAFGLQYASGTSQLHSAEQLGLQGARFAIAIIKGEGALLGTRAVQAQL